MHIHIVGICGTFMGGIAAIAKQAGFKVTGCDLNVYPPMSTQLEAMGIELISGFDPEQMSLNPDVYVIGNVVTRGNPLMEEILNQGKRYISGPQWLSEQVLKDCWVLAVAGTHGKTSTSSMLAWILEFAGLAPGFLIGGIPENFGISARLPGKPSLDPHSISPFFVIEADEYDTAFFDKRSKFVHYRPRTAVLNNLEYDHADIFPNLEAIQTQFHHLVRTVPAQGRILVNKDFAALQTTLDKGVWSEVEYFGKDAIWQAKEVNEHGFFEVIFAQENKGCVRWGLLGEHNRMNALAAISAARHVGVSIETSIEALSAFSNIKRRMEVKGIVNQVTVYDDFAHHPTAIETTLAGLRAHVGSNKIIAVLEPRSNTMKLGTMKDALAPSLHLADQVYCYAGAINWNPSAALTPLKEKASVWTDFELMLKEIIENAKPQDHILVMSNGGFGGIHQKLLDGLTDKFS